MANIAKIELGDTTYDIKDAVVRPKIDAITAEDTDGNTYVKTSQLTVDGNSNLNGTMINRGGSFTTWSDNTGYAMIIRDGRFDIDGANPSNDVWSAVHGFQDKDGDSIGYLQAYEITDGRTGLNLYVLNKDSNGSTYNNLFRLAVDKDGTKSYQVGDAAAFRTAINAVSKAGDTITGTVKFVHNNLIRSTTISSPTDGTTKLEFYDKSNNLMNFITSHKNPDGTNHTRLTTYSPNGQQTTNLYLGNDGTRKRIGTDAKWITSPQVESTNMGYGLVDSTGTEYPGVRDNGSNLWLGATETASRHHRGQTYISAGHDGTKGNATIYVSVPNAANNGGTNYGVYHTGNKPTPADIGAASTNADGAINTLASTSSQQWLVRGKINNSSNSINGHYTWLVMNNSGLSCWDATAQKTLWSVDLIPTVVDLGTHGNIYRYGKMRIVKIDSATTINLDTAWGNKVLCTVPTQDRPIQPTDGIAILKNVSGGVSVGLQITTDGQVHVHAMGGNPPGQCTIWGQVVYLVA